MILVTGASGFVGRHLIPALVEAGWPVRALVPPHRRRMSWPDGVEVTVGRVGDAAALHQAMQRVHTVFHLASAQWWGGRRDLERVDVEGTRNVIAAARAARIGRFYLLSHLGAEPSSAYPLLRVKGQVEALVRHSGLPYTIMRCGVLFGPEDRFVNNLAMLLRTNPLFFFQPGQGESLLHPLYIGDLVQALLNSLERIALVDATVEIGGAEYLTFNEMVRTVMRVSRAKRLIVSVPPYALRGVTRTVRRVLPRWPLSLQWFDLLSSNRTTKLGNLFDYCDVRPVRFEDTLLTYMPGRHYGLELLRFVFSPPRYSV